MWGGRLYINGTITPRKLTDAYSYELRSGKSIKVQMYSENFFKGAPKHYIYERTDTGPLDNTSTFKVPADHLFFMGDNRDNSYDSRSSNGFGYVPIKAIKGEVKRVMFPTKRCSPKEGVYCPPRRFMKKL